MDGIDLLRAQALQKRNTAIQAARREYHATLKEINALNLKLRIKARGRPCKSQSDGYAGLKATTVALELLRLGAPMTLVELTLEVQRCGCRKLDDPRVVAHSIRSGLRNYRDEFKRDAEGRWSISRL